MTGGYWDRLHTNEVSRRQQAETETPDEPFRKPATKRNKCSLGAQEGSLPSTAIDLTVEQDRPFPFFSLPAELRNEIYSQCRPELDIPFLKEDGTLGNKHINSLGATLRFSHISQQFRHEALNHLFSRRTFVVSQSNMIEFIQVTPPSAQAALTSMRITFFQLTPITYHHGLDRLLRQEDSRFVHNPAKLLPALRHLEVKLPGAVCVRQRQPFIACNGLQECLRCNWMCF